MFSAMPALCSFRYRSPAFHVQSWYDEVKDYSYPYPHECNPWCPDKCTGPMCTHYTQVREMYLYLYSASPSASCVTATRVRGLLVLNKHDVLADSLGHDKQDWLCCERLQADECLGRDLGERCLPGLQLLTQVRRMGWALLVSQTLCWQVT